MSRKEFSSGIATLDDLVSGFKPGDTVLTIVGQQGAWERFTAPFIDEARRRKQRIVLLSAKSAGKEASKPVRGTSQFNLPAGKRSSASVINSMKRFLASHGRDSLVLLEELSLWKASITSEKQLFSFLEILKQASAKHHSLTLLGAARGAFALDTLAAFKDLASVCLEFAELREESIILPLQLKGRYAPLKSVPLRLKNFQPAPGRRAAEESAISAGGDISPQELFPESRYKAVFENAGEAMILFTLRGDYRRANARALSLFGITQDEFGRRNPASFVPPKERNRFLRLLIQLRRKKSADESFTLQIGNKSALPVESHCAPVGDDYYIAILHEIGDRVANEKELRRIEHEYRSLIEKHPDGIAVLWQQEVKLTNREFCRLFGLSAEEVLTNLRAKDLFTPESWRKLQKAISDKGDIQPGRLELWCRRKDETTFVANVAYAPVQYLGKRCVELSVADNSLQKKLLDTISASESRFRSMIEGSRTPQALLREGLIEVANASAAEMFGMEAPGTLKGVELRRLVEEPSHPLIEPLLLAKGGGKGFPESVRLRGRRNDGSAFAMEISASVAAASGAILLSFRDVAAESAVEQEASMRRYEIEKLSEINETLDITLGREKLLRACTDRLVAAFSWEFGAVYAADAKSKELVLEHDHHASDAFKAKLSSLPLTEGFGGFMEKTRAPLFIQVKKYPSHIPHRKAFQELGLQSLLILPLVTGNSFGGMIILGSKKEKDAELHSPDLLAAISTGIGTALANATAYGEIDRLARERHELINSISTVLYIAAPNGQMRFIGKEIAVLTGFADSDFYRDASMLLKLVHPEDKSVILDRTLRLDAIRARESVEYRILPRGKASYRTIRDEFSCIRDEHGNVVAVQGSLTDVSQSQSHAEELRAMYSLDRNALASIREGIFIVDRDKKCIYWNEGMERITGKTGAEVVGHSPSEVFPHLEQHRISQFVEGALRGEEVNVDDMRYYVPRSSTIGYLKGSFAPMKDEKGSVTGVVGVIEDFTNRKQLELDMRDSEQVLRNVIDTMGDVLLIADLKGSVLEVNKSFLRVLGYSRSETIGHEFPYEWVLDAEMGKFVLWIAELRERNWLHDFDMTWRAKDGRMIPMSLSTTLLRNSMGEPIAMLNIARDITDRKRLTKDLESRTRQIEMINRIISKANETLDFDEIFHSIAAEIDEVLASDLINIGILTEDERSLTVYPLKGAHAMHKGDTIPIEQTLSKIAITSGKPAIVPDSAAALEFSSPASPASEFLSQISFPIVLKGKAFGALNIGSRTGNAYADADAQILLPIAQQIGTIIDRVQLFRQVTEDSAYIHTLLDSMGSIVYTVDTQYRIREVNKAWHEFMQESGFPGIRNYQGMNLFDVLPSASLKELFRPIVDDIVGGKIQVYAHEYVHPTVTGDRIYQLAVNPMTIDRKVTGLVFTHSDITALKKSERQLKRSNEQLLALNRISTLISTSLDLTEILDTTIPLLHKETESDAVLVYLFEQYTHELTLAKEIGFATSGKKADAGLVKGSSVKGTVMLTKEPVYISERAHLDERVLPEKREILQMVRVEALAVIPLASKNQVWGALEIFYDTPHEFSPQEQQMLSLVGNQLGTAIENAQLYQELRSQIKRLTVLYEISQHLTSTLEIDEIFSAVHESIRHVVPYETMTIALYDAATTSTTVVFRASPKEGAKIVVTSTRKAEMLIPGSAEGIVVETKLLHRDPEFHTVYVPMFSKETIIGIMSVRGTPTTALTETHLRLLESVGNLTALAVEKAKLYEETLKISLEIQRRNQELDDFTYVVSHDLKEPLISIEGFSRILQADYQGVIEDEGKEYLESIVGATTRMKGLIDDLLMLSRVSRPSEAFKAVALAKVFEDITTDMEFTIRQKKVTFIVPQPLPTVYGTEIQLQIVFRNLIGNAVKFNNKADPTVEIGFQNAENNMYLFHVKDNGIGIDKDFFDKIFVIFQRLHRREEYEGTGAGLAIVKKIIETNKGRIWIESEVGKGSSFFFTIPKGSPRNG